MNLCDEGSGGSHRSFDWRHLGICDQQMFFSSSMFERERDLSVQERTRQPWLVHIVSHLSLSRARASSPVLSHRNNSVFVLLSDRVLPDDDDGTGRTLAGRYGINKQRRYSYWQCQCPNDKLLRTAWRNKQLTSQKNKRDRETNPNHILSIFFLNGFYWAISCFSPAVLCFSFPRVAEIMCQTHVNIVYVLGWYFSSYK